MVFLYFHHVIVIIIFVTVPIGAVFAVTGSPKFKVVLIFHLPNLLTIEIVKQIKR